MYEQEIIRNSEQPNNSKLEIAVRRHIDQQMRTRNFRARNETVERRALTKRPKGSKAVVESKVGACYQWKAIGQCSRGDSCSFSHADAPRKGCGQRQEEQTSSPTPEAKVQADGKLPSKSSGHRGETPSGTRGRIPCRDFLKGTCMNSSCNHWHPPVCLNYKSLTGCACGKKSADSDMFRRRRSPAKQSKKSDGKGSVAL